MPKVEEDTAQSKQMVLYLKQTMHLIFIYEKYKTRLSQKQECGGVDIGRTSTYSA